MRSQSPVSRKPAFALALLVLPLGACASLPNSGPTGAAIINGAKGEESKLGFEVVELADLAALPPAVEAEAGPSVLMAMGQEQPTDLIGPGDVLDIVIYEAGITLFSGRNMGFATEALDPAAKAERLPSIRVDDEGYITLPYVGRIKAAGYTATDLQRVIMAGLAGKSQSPQVLVSFQQSITNSIIVGGEVARSGRLVLATNRETLVDAIALAGGYRGEATDLVVRLERQGRTVEMRLADILRSPVGGMRIFPGDRISLLREPLSYSVMGAPGQVEQVHFGRKDVSLAEAVARVGGANPNLGDAAAIFVFRFVKDEAGGEKPVVYHLNMMKPDSYFLSQKFAMRDKDVLYIGNARANQPSKFVQILSQLFSPVVTARAVTR
jgi:polysaccharide export outer membrane protein